MAEPLNRQSLLGCSDSKKIQKERNLWLLGLLDVIPARGLEGLTAEDLRLLLNGVGDINVSTLISYTSFNDESGETPDRYLHLDHRKHDEPAFNDHNRIDPHFKILFTGLYFIALNLTLFCFQTGVVQAVVVGCDREDVEHGEAGPGLLLDGLPGPARQRGGLPTYAQCYYRCAACNQKVSMGWGRIKMIRRYYIFRILNAKTLIFISILINKITQVN